MLEKLDENAISDCVTWALYDTQYPVIYLNKNSITHPELFLLKSFPINSDGKTSRRGRFPGVVCFEEIVEPYP